MAKNAAGENSAQGRTENSRSLSRSSKHTNGLAGELAAPNERGGELRRIGRAKLMLG
jgi:hypothetical protein